MAIHKSVIKRQKQADKKHLVNKSVKSALKTITKKVEQAAEEKKADAPSEAEALRHEVSALREQLRTLEERLEKKREK